MFAITAFYAALLALLFIFLCRNVIVCRRKHRIPIGDQGQSELLRRIRVQANFAEYTPLALILLGLAEAQGLVPWLLHILGLAFLAGRLLHAFGVSRTPENYAFRTTGMVLTFFVLAVCAFANLALSLGPPITSD